MALQALLEPRTLLQSHGEVTAFLAGAILAGASGWLGMSVATDGNVRTTVAPLPESNPAMPRS